jgi:hypothetical protein
LDHCLVTLSLSLSTPSCSAGHVRLFAWRPIDHGQSNRVFGPSAEADAPGDDAEALACSIICSRTDADAKSFGLDLGGWSFTSGKHRAQPGDRYVDLLRAWR